MRNLAAFLGTIALSLGLLIGVAPSEAQAATQAPAPSMDAAWDSEFPMKQEPFKLHGKIGTKVARPVILQAWRGGAWKNQVRSKTTRKGKYTFVWNTPEARVKVRVVAPKTRIHHKTYRKVTSRYRVVHTAPQAAQVFASRVMAVGIAASVVGDTNPIRTKRPVLLQVNTGAAWTTVGTARSNDDGQVDFTYTPTETGTISFRIVMAAWHKAPATTSSTRTVTVVPIGHDTATQVASGQTHTCALTSAGKVSCWGPSNFSGQLGNGSIGADYTTYPTAVVGLPDSITAISAGDDHTCALATDHTVWCWGFNGFGQLGDQTTNDTGRPVKVKGLSNVIAVEASGRTTCAVVGASPTATSGAAQCWGSNEAYLLGSNGTRAYGVTPGDVSGLSSGVTSISLGWRHACVTTESGTAKCWGQGRSGELGNGQMNSSRTPVTVRLSGVTKIAAGMGGESTWGKTCAKATGGTVWCWGSGFLGDGTRRTSAALVKVSGLSSNVSAISLGDISCVVDDGAAKCWGPNHEYQLGDGTTNDRLTPTVVNGLSSDVTSLSSTLTAFSSRSYVTTTTGAVKWWGSYPPGYRAPFAKTPQSILGFR